MSQFTNHRCCYCHGVHKEYQMLEKAGNWYCSIICLNKSEKKDEKPAVFRFRSDRDDGHC